MRTIFLSRALESPKAVTWAASHFAARVSFPDDPEFDGKFFILGDDETALRNFFDAGRRGRLAGIADLQMAGQGDGFHFTLPPFRSSGKPDRREMGEKLQDILRDARALFEILKA